MERRAGRLSVHRVLTLPMCLLPLSHVPMLLCTPFSLPASARALVLSLQHGLIVRIVVAYGSSLISAVYISGVHIAAIGVDSKREEVVSTTYAHCRCKHASSIDLNTVWRASGYTK
eukprot:1903-Heterococcus_DN1.PRE.3